MKTLKYSIITTAISVILAALVAFLFQRLNTVLDQKAAAEEAQKVLISDVQTYKDKYGNEHTVTTQMTIELDVLKHSKDSLQRKVYQMYSQMPKKEQKALKQVTGATIEVHNTIELKPEQKDSSKGIEITSPVYFTDGYLSGYVYEEIGIENKTLLEYSYQDTAIISISGYKDKWKIRNIFHKRPARYRADASLSNKNAKIENLIYIDLKSSIFAYS